jgi:hypothetical protein
MTMIEQRGGAPSVRRKGDGQNGEVSNLGHASRAGWADHR